MGAPLASVAVVARTIAKLWIKPIIGKFCWNKIFHLKIPVQDNKSPAYDPKSLDKHQNPWLVTHI